uniref:Uncharacterized protein n=1 Tax=Anguilla anguilla TaxID=7936 RepID=A0A0E9PP61_ANGAN
MPCPLPNSNITTSPVLKQPSPTHTHTHTHRLSYRLTVIHADKLNLLQGHEGVYSI